ncbi:MAG: hypothetical protein VKK03_08140 [Synechococcus sp.]|nr:hypothetical protein [Synechococcus sp.]
MGELSDRFAELMARMAKSDADLFRTIGEQNASVRKMVEDLVPPDDAATASANAPLAASALLPAEECALPALKKRFRKVAEAQTWVEAQIGKAPKKPTWAVIEATCLSGAWPNKAAASTGSRSKGLTEARFEQGLKALEDSLDQRLQRIELILTLLAKTLPEANDSSAT